MKWYILAYVFAGCQAVVAIDSVYVGDGQASRHFLLAIVFGALGYYLMKQYKKKHEADQPTSEQIVPTEIQPGSESQSKGSEVVPISEPVPSEPKKPYRDYVEFNLAGVTFDNEDGTSRQKLLEDLFKFGEPVIYTADDYDPDLDFYEYEDDDGEIHRKRKTKPKMAQIEEDVKWELYDYQGKDAIRLLAPNGCLGVVPKGRTQEIKNILFGDQDLNPFFTMKIGKYDKFYDEDAEETPYFATVHIAYDNYNK